MDTCCLSGATGTKCCTRPAVVSLPFMRLPRSWAEHGTAVCCVGPPCSHMHVPHRELKCRRRFSPAICTTVCGDPHPSRMCHQPRHIMSRLRGKAAVYTCGNWLGAIGGDGIYLCCQHCDDLCTPDRMSVLLMMLLFRSAASASWRTSRWPVWRPSWAAPRTPRPCTTS